MVRSDSIVCMGVIAVVAMVMLAGCGRGAGTMNIEPEPTQPEPTQPTNPEPMQFEWRLVTERTGGVLNDVVWGAGRFVAVGEGGEIVHSTDGDTWTQASGSAIARDLHGITWADGHFVAVGDGGGIVHSTDGDTWTEASHSATTRDLYGITWGGERFAAVGEGGEIVYSTDGKHWTRASDIPTYPSTLRGIAWSGERFVAVGDVGVIWHSIDADTWRRAQQTLGIFLGVSEVYGGVAWSGTRFVAIAGAGLAGTRVAYSSDGNIWEGVPDFLGAGIGRCEPCRFHGITWDGARFVAVGAGGEIVHSTDGDTWTEASHSATSRNLHGVAGSGTRFVAVGGAIVASP